MPVIRCADDVVDSTAGGGENSWLCGSLLEVDVTVWQTILDPCCRKAAVGGHVAVQQFVGCSSAG